MRSIDVCVRHDDDAAIAQLCDVKPAFVLAVAVFLRFADARADRRDHRLDFVVLEELVFARLLDVDQFAPDRQDRLITSIASLFGRTAGRVAFDNVKLGQLWIALRAIRQLSRQSAASERAFANRLARFTRGFPRARRRQDLVEDATRKRRVLVKICHQAVINDGIDDPFDLRVHELDLCLRFETRVRQFDAKHADQTFPHVVTGDRRIFVFEKIARFRVLIDRFGQRCAKSGEMGPAVWIWNRIRERQNLIVIAVVVLQDNIDKNFVALPRN